MGPFNGGDWTSIAGAQNSQCRCARSVRVLPKMRLPEVRGLLQLREWWFRRGPNSHPSPKEWWLGNAWITCHSPLIPWIRKHHLCWRGNGGEVPNWCRWTPFLQARHVKNISLGARKVSCASVRTTQPEKKIMTFKTLHWRSGREGCLFHKYDRHTLPVGW